MFILTQIRLPCSHEKILMVALRFELRTPQLWAYWGQAFFSPETVFGMKSRGEARISQVWKPYFSLPGHPGKENVWFLSCHGGNVAHFHSICVEFAYFGEDLYILVRRDVTRQGKIISNSPPEHSRQGKLLNTLSLGSCLATNIASPMRLRAFCANHLSPMTPLCSNSTGELSLKRLVYFVLFG